VNSHASKDDLRFLKHLKGVNERSNVDRIIFKHYKHVGLIQNNITIKMSRVIGWQLQDGFHNEQKIYLGYGKVQGGVANTC
jgi:hypothetical protein